MQINEKIQGDVLILAPEGELMGGDEMQVFLDRIYEAIRSGQVYVVVDMGKVNWMNSSGLGMIMAALTTLRGSEGDLSLANISDRVKRPVEVTKLNSVIQIFDTVDEAVQKMNTGG